MIPKFRAWLEKKKKMVEVRVIDWNNRVIDSFAPFIEIDFDEVTFMQSTGLKDKNGKEIFVGDIVKMAKDFYSEPAYYEVIRHRGGAYRLESNQHGCELWLRHTNCEVIGNIYENPELLEVEE